jgi:hypothetical protein
MNEIFLTHLRQAVEILLKAMGPQLSLAVEDERQFDLSQGRVHVDSLARLGAAFSPCLDVVSLTLSYTLQQWVGGAVLCPQERIEIRKGRLDTGLTPAPLDPALIPLSVQVQTLLGGLHTQVDLPALAQQLAALQQGGAALEIRCDISIDKTALVKNLVLPDTQQCLFFVRGEKLLDRVDQKVFAELDSLWKPNPENRYTALMVADARGWAGSTGIKILGLDEWKPAQLVLPPDEAYEKRMRTALDFRKEETSWDARATTLTPEQFRVQESSYSDPALLQTLDLFCAQACVSYLANRVSGSVEQTLGGEQFICEFHGNQRYKVCLPLQCDQGLSTAALFGLYAWSYENSSSDKLNIARQIVAFQLGDDAHKNFQLLVDRSAEILRTARNNFQVYLRKGVEDYFTRRLKLVEFVAQFSQSTAAAVTQLTSDLTGDLYKTVGVILGVVLAALVDPRATRPVIFWTSLLYLGYILLILAYALPSVYFRFASSIQHYRSSKNEMRSLLSEDEILKTESKTYTDSLWLFRIYFGLTNGIYAALAALAYLIMQANLK